MKKKIITGIMLGITCVTALIMLCTFTTPIFYNTDYSISERGISCGYIRIVDGELVEYYENDTDTEPMVYKCVMNGDTLTYGHYTFKIKNRFKLVLSSNDNCTATPSGGGATLFEILLLINIPATLILAIMLGEWITKKLKYQNEQINKVQILEDILVREKIINQEDLDKIYPKEKEEHIEHCPEEHIEHCSNCGYQLFDEDTKCPNCGKDRKDKQ